MGQRTWPAVAAGFGILAITSLIASRPLTSPLDIDIQFVPTASAPIRPDTFLVCYVGLVTIDLTKRITDRVTVSATGLHVTGAQLPRGRHHLLMLIADQHGRLGRREAVLDIY